MRTAPFRIAGLLLLAAVLPASFTSLSAAEAQVVRFAGATSLDRMLRPVMDAVGASQGIKIESVPNGTGRGIEDLVAGRAQVAMVAGSLPYFVRMINEKTPGAADEAKLQKHVLFDLNAVIIVHPSNSVSSLTLAQIGAIFAGKTTNWKEVGGPDLPIVVVIPGLTDGIRAVFATDILSGKPFSTAARTFQTAPELSRVVAQIPGGVSFVSSKMSAPSVKVVPPATAILIPYFFVTVGEPPAPIKSAIKEFQSKLKP